MFALTYIIGQIGQMVLQLFLVLFEIPLGDLPLTFGSLLLFFILIKIALFLFGYSDKTSQISSSTMANISKGGVQSSASAFSNLTSYGYNSGKKSIKKIRNNDLPFDSNIGKGKPDKIYPSDNPKKIDGGSL